MRQVVGVLTLVGLIAATSACGGSTASDVSAVRITTFSVPKSTSCAGQTSTTVQVRYVTVHAQRKRLQVDGREISGTDPESATLAVPVHCDSLPHTFVLIAYDERGRKVSKQKLLTTEL